ncbi:Gamma-interferon-inducible-lysosomal thiol reductase [Gossypium arboreum]|uniref:Gamma-interferon-inducible-lysosomal thiol reductase n=1 Tax=Gossypium arboreum TaxID=29729 RepID=A0A0B0MZG8_GOSAR|nr:Gamma-interferon-inducible-lysosomal thiol reductase [Gossypium arboreum]
MQLLLQYAKETSHLKPPQEYVPWAVVNNQPLRQGFENFVKYVCQACKGDHKPAACKAQSSSLNPTIHASHNNSSCRLLQACTSMASISLQLYSEL